MSLGVNLLMYLTEIASKSLGDNYLSKIFEIHHKHKKDYPSGTALMLGKGIADGKNKDLYNLIGKKFLNKKNFPYGKKIENLIKKIGIFRIKAKSIYLMSKQLLEKHNGKVPKTFEELEKLPGVGHKTASVVMSQGFGYPAFAVDTHIHRLAQRWGLTNGKNVIQTEKDLKRIFPKNAWSKLHLQIIYYGREYCKARECYGLTCKICNTCYPNRKKPLITKKA